ncbi:nurim [Lepisosteus oculatus]|uniref:nurim n=1 Tax=Lepisosteus oculatus TaxID=7918 RepID=UPI0035F52F62
MAAAAVTLPSLCLAALTLLNFVFVFGTGAEFVRFLSFRAIYRNLTGGAPVCVDSVSWGQALRDQAVVRALCVDGGLVLLFALQHSALAWAPVKQACRAVLGVMNRAFYVFTTALALQVMMRCWRPVSGAPCLWSVSSAPWDTWLPLLCFVLHFVCWLVICSILLIFDYPELLGIKQVYYHCLGLGDPLAMKSPRAQRLYAHLRHPVFLELCAVLWAVPCLPPDRLLLAAGLTAYLGLGHSLDPQDCAYLGAQLHSKLRLFSEPQGSPSAGAPNHRQD